MQCVTNQIAKSAAVGTQVFILLRLHIQIIQLLQMPTTLDHRKNRAKLSRCILECGGVVSPPQRDAKLLVGPGNTKENSQSSRTWNLFKYYKPQSMLVVGNSIEIGFWRFNLLCVTDIAAMVPVVHYTVLLFSLSHNCLTPHRYCL